MSKHSKLMFAPFTARSFSYPHIKRLNVAVTSHRLKSSQNRRTCKRNRLQWLPFSTNLLEAYHKCPSQIGYAQQHALAATYFHFQSVCEENLDKVLNN